MSNNRLLHGLGLLALLCATSSGSALTIGRQQGQVVLGRPLEIQVPVGLDPGMAAADLCPEAEVSYGETRLPARLVDVQVTGSGEVARVQVRAMPPLDEPFASVQLRVGCSQRLARRFVLLAEEPMSPRASAAELMAPSEVDGLPPVRAEVPAPAPAAADEPRPPALADAQAPARADAQAPARAFTRASVATTSRLRLDPVDTRLPRSDLATTAIAGGPALLGEDMGMRNLSLQAEIRQLHQALQTSHNAGAALRGRLVEAERERFANPVVFGLAAVTALSLLLAALVWRRAAAAQRPRPGPLPLAARAVSTLPAAPWPLAPIEAQGPTPVPARPTGVHTRFAMTPGEDTAAGAAPGSGPDSAVSGADPIKEEGKARSLASMNARLPEPVPLNTQELNDVQQEADFFVSLGEHDRAIELLRQHIEQHPQSSALAWLDLLEIQHKLGRRDDYEQVRRDFEWLFNVKLPSFENFNSEHDDLEAHPELMARIQAVWPKPAVLKEIDAAMFRRPVDDQGKPLGLQAYRDLLLLHQLAQAPATRARETKPAHASMHRGKGVRDLAIDLDLDAILAHPSAAPDPTHSPVSQERFAQGLEALIHFDNEESQAAEPTPGLTQEAAWASAQPVIRRAG